MNQIIRFILMDIEGTTTDIRFVHNVLFPYSQQYLKPYVQENLTNPFVQAALEEVKATVAQEENGKIIDAQQALGYLSHWILTDRKHTALKSLQGLIWEAGYRQEMFKAHLYEDVPGCLGQWKAQGLGLGIYSSGSIKAQQLLFSHSDFGDLTPLLDYYFDTSIGPKIESASYRQITANLKLAPQTVLFVSDVPEELASAQEAGLQVIQSVRPGIRADLCFAQAETFYAVSQYLQKFVTA